MVIARDDPAVIDQIFVENRYVFIQNSVPSLILIVLSRLDRGVQSAT